MKILPYDTWGRSQQASGGKGRWHLLVELRRNTSGGILGGRWGQVPANGLFGLAACGQVVNDPVADPAPLLHPYTWYKQNLPVAVPVGGSTSWCLPCAEAKARQAGSVRA